MLFIPGFGYTDTNLISEAFDFPGNINKGHSPQFVLKLVYQRAYIISRLPQTTLKYFIKYVSLNQNNSF